jgi:hypothetical protein
VRVVADEKALLWLLLSVAVTVVLDADYEKTSMVCALFHDIDDVRSSTSPPPSSPQHLVLVCHRVRSLTARTHARTHTTQGPDFGRLIAKAILAGFLKEYPEFTAGTPPARVHCCVRGVAQFIHECLWRTERFVCVVCVWPERSGTQAVDPEPKVHKLCQQAGRYYLQCHSVYPQPTYALFLPFSRPLLCNSSPYSLFVCAHMRAFTSSLCPVKMKHKGLVSSLLLFDEGQQPVTSGVPHRAIPVRCHACCVTRPG